MWQYSHWRLGLKLRSALGRTTAHHTPAGSTRMLTAHRQLCISAHASYRGKHFSLFVHSAISFQNKNHKKGHWLLHQPLATEDHGKIKDHSTKSHLGGQAHIQLPRILLSSHLITQYLVISRKFKEQETNGNEPEKRWGICIPRDVNKVVWGNICWNAWPKKTAWGL